MDIISESNAGTVDTTPRKMILWNSVAICAPKNAITEIQDNIVDYVAERIKVGGLDQNIVKSSFNLSQDEVTIRWNLGIPPSRRIAMLTPGLHVADDAESVGTWSVGGKIAIHALGDNITIRTCTPGEDVVTLYRYPSGWLRDSSGNYNKSMEKDWRVLKDIEDIGADGNDFTEIVIKNPATAIKRDFDKRQEETYFESMSDLVDYVGGTYGLTFEKMKKDVTFEIWINGKKIDLVTYSSPENIKNNLVRVPGFEPTWHEYFYSGLKVRVLVGCTPKMDVDNGGTYFYGNHDRLFARRERNPELLNEIDVTHPQKKNWQMHIFFSGDTNLIPWNSPLKEGVNYGHPTMHMLKPILNKLPLPYIELVLKTHAPERFVFSEKYMQMNEDERKKELFKDEKERDELWNSLPQIAKDGRAYSNDIIEVEDHGSLIDAQRSRTSRRDPKWTHTLAKNWLRSNQITQNNTKTSQQKIDALWKFSKVINPAEIRPTISPEEDEYEDGMEAKTGDAKAIVPRESPTHVSSFPEFPVEEEKEVLSARIKVTDIRRLRIAAHSAKPTEIMNFLVDTFYMNQRLLNLPSMPEKVMSKQGLKERMEALIEHFESQNAE